MGSGYKYGCPNCKFTFGCSTGVGFMFPAIYKETVQRARAGELGQEIKSFFEMHEDGAINAEEVMLCCDEYGHLATGKDLTMYTPKSGMPKQNEHGRWSIAAPFENENYVSEYELEEFYDEYAKYKHTCEECGGNMHVVGADEKLMCPKCRTQLELTGRFLWD